MVITASAVAAILTAVASGVAIGATVNSGAQQVHGAIDRAHINELSTKLTRYYNSNEAEWAKLVEAYNSGNTNLANQLLAATPMGAGYSQLKSKIKSRRQEYSSKRDEYLKKQADINADITKLNNAAMNTDSHTGAGYAETTMREIESKYDAALQSTNGGLQEK